MTVQSIDAGQEIVRWHAGWAAGASIVPLPFLDMAGVMAVQVAMVHRLARLHGAAIDRVRARALVLSALGGAVSPSVTAVGVPSLLKAVPGIGTLLGSVAAPASAAAATLALGDFFNRRFADGLAVPEPEPARLAAPEPVPSAEIAPGRMPEAEAMPVQVQPMPPVEEPPTEIQATPSVAEAPQSLKDSPPDPETVPVAATPPQPIEELPPRPARPARRGARTGPVSTTPEPAGEAAPTREAGRGDSGRTKRPPPGNAKARAGKRGRPAPKGRDQAE